MQDHHAVNIQTRTNKCGSKRWVVRWRAPDGTQPSKSLESKGAAEAFRRTKIVQSETGGQQTRNRLVKVTLGEFVAELLELRIGPRGQRLTASTLEQYKRALDLFEAHVGSDTPLEAITAADGARFAAWCQTLKRSVTKKPPKHPKKPPETPNISQATINKHKANVMQAFNVAVHQLGYLRSNPLRLKKDKLADKAPAYVEPATFVAVIEACRTLKTRSVRRDGLWWEAFLTVCYTAGPRVNEAVHLAWPDIDFDALTIRIIAKPEQSGLAAWRPKDYDSRTVPVPASTFDLLQRLYDRAPEGCEFPFIPQDRVDWIRAQREADNWSEVASTLNNLPRTYREIQRVAAVKAGSFHDLRRSAISHWARQLPAAVVRELAGHASIETTLKYYVNIGQSDLDRAREVTAAAIALPDPV